MTHTLINDTMTAISDHPFTPHDLDSTEFRKLFDHRLRKVISGQNQNKRLLEALEYATQSGGKLIRPSLVYEFALLGGLGHKTSMLAPIVDCAIAIELIHTYSLIHDDLPAMDNSLLRRGRPTCWVEFGQATAILVGDALLPLAFEILSQLPDVSEEKRLLLINLIAKMIGPNGLVAGQMMDLYPPKGDQTDNQTSQADWVEVMQILKTGVLLGGSCGAGLILSGCLDKLDSGIQFGEHLGVLYQLTDDLLDALGDESTVGKTVQNDQEKLTFLSLYTIDQVKNMASELALFLKDQIHRDFKGNSNLLQFVDKLTTRHC